MLKQLLSGGWLKLVTLIMSIYKQYQRDKRDKKIAADAVAKAKLKGMQDEKRKVDVIANNVDIVRDDRDPNNRANRRK